MEVPRNLRRAANSERGFATAFFGREEKRVEYAARRAEEASEEAQGKQDEKPTGGGGEGDEGPTEEEKLETAFLAMEATFLEEMGLNAEAADAPAA